MYTVLDGITQFTVCLHQRTCTCGRFQLDELPCPHALAVLTIKHTGYEKYCSAYYTRKNLLLTYQFQMDPLPNESTWNTPTHVIEDIVLPPHGKRPPGRTKNKRHAQLREDGLRRRKLHAAIVDNMITTGRLAKMSGLMIKNKKIICLVPQSRVIQFNRMLS